MPQRPRSAAIPTLGVEGLLPLLVLGDFVRLVLAAFLAVGPTGFRDVHLEGQGEVGQHSQEPRREMEGREATPRSGGSLAPALARADRPPFRSPPIGEALYHHPGPTASPRRPARA